jgi:hypothetical protein
MLALVVCLIASVSGDDSGGVGGTRDSMCLADQLQRQVAQAVQVRLEHGAKKYGCDAARFPFTCESKTAHPKWGPGLTITGDKCLDMYKYAVQHNVRQYAANTLTKAKINYGCTINPGFRIEFTRHKKSGIVDGKITNFGSMMGGKIQARLSGVDGTAAQMASADKASSNTFMGLAVFGLVFVAFYLKR